ncbi:MAG TPA: hypothetical protein VK671_03555 [Mucilaginibacter sp.]|nr:hypothetical protein [Mucilaginibacter sp.]
MESADTIKLIIESRVCPVHDVHPLVEATGNELKISCCCSGFHMDCSLEAISLFMMNKEYPYWVLQE